VPTIDADFGKGCARHSKMRNDEQQALKTLTVLVAGREDLVSRIAAPLWARVGRRLDSSLRAACELAQSN
jgi:hypothetical protein